MQGNQGERRGKLFPFLAAVLLGSVPDGRHSLDHPLDCRLLRLVLGSSEQANHGRGLLESLSGSLGATVRRLRLDETHPAPPEVWLKHRPNPASRPALVCGVFLYKNRMMLTFKKLACIIFPDVPGIPLRVR